MMKCKKWDIILVPFPFTNLTSVKQRPGLVLSPDSYNKGQDVVIAFITSNLQSLQRVGDYFIENWEESGLPKPSMIRMKFATIDRSIIRKKIGKLRKSDSSSFSGKLIEFFEI